MDLRCLVVLCLLCPGCGRSSPPVPELIPVTGFVTLNKKPLPHAAIAFHPKESGDSSFGRTDEQGKFILKYSNGSDGAVVGSHRVEIRTREEIVDAGGKVVSDRPEILPERYHNQSILNAEVDADHKELQFDLNN